MISWQRHRADYKLITNGGHDWTSRSFELGSFFILEGTKDLSHDLVKLAVIKQVLCIRTTRSPYCVENDPIYCRKVTCFSNVYSIYSRMLWSSPNVMYTCYRHYFQLLVWMKRQNTRLGRNRYRRTSPAQVLIVNILVLYLRWYCYHFAISARFRMGIKPKCVFSCLRRVPLTRQG